MSVVKSSLCAEFMDVPLIQIVYKWRRLLQGGESRFYPAGAFILAQSCAATKFYVVESGIVKLSRTPPTGGRRVAVMLRFAGDVIGLDGTLVRSANYLSASAANDCTLLELPAAQVLGLIRNRPELSAFVAERQTIDATRVNWLLLQQRLLNAEQRLFHLLAEIGRGVDSSRLMANHVCVSVPLTEADIADLVGITPCAFSRMKKSLVKKGLLRQSGKLFSFHRKTVKPGW